MSANNNLQSDDGRKNNLKYLKNAQWACKNLSNFNTTRVIDHTLKLTYTSLLADN